MKKILNWLFDYPNLQVYQYEEAFKFSLDSILLAEFASIKKDDEKIMDFCTGNGVIPILLHFKYQKKVIGIEIQKEIYDLALDSVKINHMEDSISLICDSVMNLGNYFPGNNFDIILCNPPYFKVQEDSHVNDNSFKKIARHEVTITLEEIICMASKFLKNKGKFYMVHVPERIDEIFVYANRYGMAVKELQFIFSNILDKPIIVLVTLVKGGRFGTKVYPSICIQGLNTYQNLFQRR